MDEIMCYDEIKPGQVMRPGQTYRQRDPTSKTGWIIVQAPTAPQHTTGRLTEWAAFDRIYLGE